MKQILSKSLDDELCQYLNNVINIRNCFLLYKEIKSHTSDKIDKINRYPYTFYLIVCSLQQVFVIECTKILNKDESESIYHFIKLCKLNKNIVDNEAKLIEELKVFKEYLNQKQTLIKNIENLRNKFYAHADKEYFVNVKTLFEENNVKNNELEDLIENLYLKIKKIYSMFHAIMVIDTKKEIINEFNSIVGKI